MFGANLVRVYLLIGFLIAHSVAIAGDPALPGHHPLSQSQAGRVLIAELRCAACHSGIEVDTLPEKLAPDLAEAGARISPKYMRQFLESPSVAHPGTTMPDVLAARPESERPLIAEALTHFLVWQSKGSVSQKLDGSNTVDREKGKALYHSVGCVACHGPQELSEGAELKPLVEVEEDEIDDPVATARKKIKPIAASLNHVSAKYSVRSLGDFLFQPLQVRKSGRMPDMKLTPSESLAIAGYLCGEQQPQAELVPDATLVEAGRKYFQSLNCASCHRLPGVDAAAKVGSLKNADLSRGCLTTKTESSGSNSPHFELDDHQLAAIREALSAGTVVDSDEIALAKTLTAFRCIACHVRDDYGGVHDAHNPFFKGSELNLGDDGRIPPPLTLMGAKLQPNWLKKVLFDGESVRHYMSTRMPQYGADNLEHLPGLFRRLDVLTGPAMKIPNPESRNENERQQEKLIRAAGRELLGDKGANCVACHSFNGKAANVNQGIDLLTSYERLQPAWFHSYLQKPRAFRPRTVMPSAWPDGVAAFTTILDGDTDRQIEAIWYYLSLGTSAADPPGVRSVSTKLEVGDHALLHRGRSRVAGFRGIAVGLPGKLNYAFNAETGTLSAIWQGEFIGVNWSGQGSGDFNPASEPIQLAQDVSFAVLENDDSPWPLMPVMTKDAPVNPNPLYPKNVGYQFRGYYLDEHSVPTFQYRSGAVAIEDRSVAVTDDGQKTLKRLLRFDAPMPQTLWFRALVGEIARESDQLFSIGRLRLTIPVTEAKLRPLSSDSKQAELLLRLQIPQGQSSLELSYELLKK